MHVSVDFSGLFLIFSLYFGRKWTETGECRTASTTISFSPDYLYGAFRSPRPLPTPIPIRVYTEAMRREFRKFQIERRGGPIYRHLVEDVWAGAKLAIMRAVLAFALATGLGTAALAEDRPEQIVAVEPHAGAFVVPVVLNDVITAKFIVDSGAADVSITEDMVSTLIKSGTMTGADLLGNKTYMLADGTMLQGKIYRMASMRVGELVMKDVTVRIAAANSSLLLGQSFLRRLKSWSMDNARQVMIIN
jgi:clan AA aspartic protease (TIGR02281 family)